MFLYYIRGLLHPHCYTDHYVMQEQPSFQYYELVFITRTCTTVQAQFYIGKIVFQHVLPWWMYNRVFPRGCGDTRELYCRCIVYKPAIPGQFKRLPVSKIVDNLLDYLCYN